MPFKAFFRHCRLAQKKFKLSSSNSRNYLGIQGKWINYRTILTLVVIPSQYHHEQSEVISCLEDQLEQVTPKCQEQLVDIAKMQADDYHLDRPLFYACQEAVSKFCPETKSGDGRIYKCLLENKNNVMMPKKV